MYDLLTSSNGGGIYFLKHKFITGLLDIVNKIRQLIFLLFFYRINDHSSPISSRFGRHGFKIKKSSLRVSPPDFGKWAFEENMLKSF